MIAIRRITFLLIFIPVIVIYYIILKSDISLKRDLTGELSRRLASHRGTSPGPHGQRVFTEKLMFLKASCRGTMDSLRTFNSKCSGHLSDRIVKLTLDTI